MIAQANDEDPDSGAAGQQAGTAAARPAIPRTTDGKPDLSGIWSVMNAVNSNILPHAASADVPAASASSSATSIPSRLSDHRRGEDGIRVRPRDEQHLHEHATSE